MPKAYLRHESKGWKSGHTRKTQRRANTGPFETWPLLASLLAKVCIEETVQQPYLGHLPSAGWLAQTGPDPVLRQSGWGSSMNQRRSFHLAADP
jgi:hypothetical protein